MTELLDLLVALTLAVLGVACVALLLALVGLGGSSASRSRALKGARVVPNVTLTDITTLAPPMPAEVADCSRVLELHGFRRLGAVSAAADGPRSQTVWLMLDGAGIQAQLVDQATRPRGLPASVLWLVSSFADGAALETAYVNGVELEEPDLRLQVAPSSVKDALQAHRKSMERFSREHGDPLPIRTMAEYLKWEASHRARFGEREARALVGYLFDDTIDSFHQSLRRLGQAFAMLALTLVILLVARQIAL
jgi:hypothetical protein